ncbi:hypothetical protein AMTR_s00149p00095140 [Amborella trichopoda]|uniref:Uncharacterized protein n=1 Tax=Amborella trichopoda TaxID=13333 RepID=W1PQ37_AMBTC|nr:hypothetical protein AMTR_s00149p00095140 [Amborella trichopoda]
MGSQGFASRLARMPAQADSGKSTCRNQEETLVWLISFWILLAKSLGALPGACENFFPYCDLEHKRSFAKLRQVEKLLVC